VPIAEGEIRRQHDRLLLVAARDDLKEQIGGVRVVAEIPDLVDGQHLRARVVTQPSFEAPRRLLGIEIEEEIGGRREEGRVALQNGLVDEVLGNERFAEALRADQDDVFGLGQEVEAEQALDERAIEGLGPVPFEVGDRLEAAETRALEAALERWSLKP
jgi:hypothetical protein